MLVNIWKIKPRLSKQSYFPPHNMTNIRILFVILRRKIKKEIKRLKSWNLQVNMIHKQ
ncbi:Uncharacterised protein [Segatella oris]|uniref:Uncharacterized protein n=1 Tax=Segatella oris TaxID=28135 RepID=A0A448L6M2_9BACT|nr:Uncharacterised protein [Segatella oris]